MPRFRVPVRLMLEVQTASLPEAWAEVNDYLYVGRRFIDVDGADLPIRIVTVDIENEPETS
jgi:hypothetical protein